MFAYPDAVITVLKLKLAIAGVLDEIVSVNVTVTVAPGFMAWFE